MADCRLIFECGIFAEFSAEIGRAQDAVDHFWVSYCGRCPPQMPPAGEGDSNCEVNGRRYAGRGHGFAANKR